MKIRKLSLFLSVCIAAQSFPIHLFAAEFRANEDVQSSIEETVSSESSPQGDTDFETEVPIVTMEPIIEGGENTDSIDRGGGEIQDDTNSEESPDPAPVTIPEEPASSPSTAAESGDIYNEELKIRFNPNTGIVTDADEDITSLHLPESIDGAQVKSIGAKAFYNCTALTEVVLPEGIGGIPNQAFYGCSSLASVVLPESVKEIGWYAFYSCKSLTEITLPEGLERIGDGAFSSCGLTSIRFPDSLQRIGVVHEWNQDYSGDFRYLGVFSSCTKLTEITFGTGITEIGTDAFSSCSSLKEVHFPDSVERIGCRGFQYCSALETVELPHGMKSVGAGLFRGCASLKAIEIPEGVTTIGYGAFEGCKQLDSVVLPDSIGAVGTPGWYWSNIDYTCYYTGSAFANCPNLTYLTIPESVSDFGEGENSQSFKYSHTVNFDSKTTLRVKEGSEAEKYAVKHKLKYIYYFDERSLCLNIYTPDGNLLTEGCKTVWYRRDSEVPAANGQMLSVFSSQEQYDYEITLSEELLQDYLPPGRQQAEQRKEGNRYITEYTLIPRNKITVNGSVLDESGSPIQGAVVVFEQLIEGKYKKSATVTADRSGNYTAFLSEAPTTVSYYADGYVQTTGAEVAFTGAECTLEAVRMQSLPTGRIQLSMEKINAAEEGARAKTESITSSGGIEFSLYNQTEKRQIERFEVQYPYLYMDGAEVKEGDRIQISAKSSSGEMEDASVFVTFKEEEPAFAELSFISHGKVRISVDKNSSAFIFDSSGIFQKKYTGSGKIISDPLPAGSYSLAVFQNTPILTGMPSLDALQSLGLVEGKDYLYFTFEIYNGGITNLGRAEIPEFDASVFCYTDPAATGCDAKQSNVSVGSLLSIRVEYRIEESYQSSSEQIILDLPEGLSVIPGSLTVDGKKSNYHTEGSMAAVDIGKKAAVVRFYVSASDAGSYHLNAYLNFDNKGQNIMQPVGTAAFEAAEVSVNTVSDTGSRSIAVSGGALPKSTVQLYDNNVLVATTAANSASSWSVRFDLVNPGSYSDHNIYAEITSVYGVKYRSAVHKLVYDKNICDLKRITMFHNGQSVVVDYFSPDPTSSSYIYESGQPFSFKAEFTGDNVENVQLEIRTGSGGLVQIPCTYDQKEHCYLASYSEGFVAGVGAVYNQPLNQSVSLFTGVCGSLDGQDYQYSPVKKGNVYKKPSPDMEFGIVDIYPKRASNGKVTLFLDGCLFEPDLSVVLSSGKAEYEAEKVYWGSHQRVYAEFDLTEAFDGLYSITVSDDGKKDVLKNCFTVDTSLGAGKSSVHIGLSETTRPGVSCNGVITVKNTGHTDICAPVLKLKGRNLRFKLPGEEEFQEKEFQEEGLVFARNYEGLAGVIAPGETGCVDFTYVCEKEGDFSLEVDDYSSKSGNIYGEVSLDADSSVSDILTSNMIALIGASYQEYSESMADMASAIGTAYEKPITPELLESMYEQNARGSLGGGDSYSVTDLISADLSVERTYSNDLHRKHSGGIWGIGWENGWEVKAEYVEQDGAESILLMDGSSMSVFIQDPKQGGFVNLIDGELRAERQKDGSILVRCQNGDCQIFDSSGRLKSISDIYGNEIVFHYQEGVLSSMTTSDGDSLEYAYKDGKVSAVSSPVTGERVSYQYDGDYLISAVTKYGTTTYSYDRDSIGGRRGALTGIAYPDGTHESYAYNELGGLESVTDAAGTVSYTYGKNEVTAEDDTGKKTRTAYDLLGNAIWTIDAYGNAGYYAYDSGSYLTKESFGLFHSTKYKYNKKNELVSVHPADGNAASYAYGVHGGIASVTDPLSNVTRYDEDENGMLGAIVYADGNSRKYSYDKKGNLTSATDGNGVTAKYDYDDRNNLTRAEFSTGNKISYTYNKRNDVTEINEDGKITALEYDEKGDLIKITYPGQRTVSYGYDDLGRCTSVTDSEGKVTGYGYNEKGWLSTVYDGTEALITYTYFKDGKLKKQENANGTYTTYTYQDGMLSEICNYGPDESPQSHFAYEYDDFGHIRSMETLEGAWKYEYDLAGQLTKAVDPEGKITKYSYDGAGNRTGVESGGEKTAYTVNNMNQYLTAGDVTRKYDADGNLLEETSKNGVTAYEWDYQGRLAKVTTADHHVYEYEYDVFGGRSKVTKDGVSTEYVNDPVGSGYALTSYKGQETTRYLLSNGVAAMGTDDGMYFYNFNHIGSVSELTGPEGSQANRYTYDNEGNVLSRKETVDNPYTYAGAYGIVDDGNGLWYDRARYVSQETDSFISLDPSAQSYDLNMYRYVGNNAVNYLDINGEYHNIWISFANKLLGGLYKKARGERSTISEVLKFLKGVDQEYEVLEKIRERLGGSRYVPKIKLVRISVPSSMGTVSKGLSGVTNPIKAREQWVRVVKATSVAKRIVPKEFLPSVSKGLLKTVFTRATVTIMAANLIGKIIGAIIHGLGWDYQLGLWLGKVLPMRVAIWIGKFAPPPSPDEDISPSPVKTSNKSIRYSIPIRYSIDPSGYVYEGVSGNRLEGVKAVIYYEGYPVDEFGQPDEEAGLQPVLWSEAGDYNQINPQYTGRDGKYRWDVPPGRWKVQFTKEGYEEYWTDWMEVPPEYTDVNINMKNLAAPVAEKVNVYSDCVQIIFSQYMDMESVLGNAVTVKSGNTEINGTIKAVDAGYDYGEENQYAKIYEFYPDEMLKGSITVAAADAQSYCGMKMESFQKTEPVSEKPQEVSVSVDENIRYGSEALMSIDVIPNEAGAHKEVEILVDNPAVADAGQHKLVLDGQGHGEIPVTGKMPGMAVFEAKVKGTALYCSKTVTVFDDAPASEPIRMDLSSCEIKLEYGSAVYTGEALEPAVTVADQGIILDRDVDYTVAYLDNVNAGNAVVSITGQNLYCGKAEAAFTIEKAKNAITVGKSEYEFLTSDQEEQTFKLEAAAKGGRLSYHSDRESVTVDETGKVTIARSFEGAATVTITAEDENYEKAEQAIQITVRRAGKTDLSGYSAELEYKSAVYTGKALEPSVTVADQGKTLEKGTDYSVAYKNNINAGEAAVVITGQGSYTGTIEKKFTIEKAQNAITVVKSEYEFLTSDQEEQTFKLDATAKGGRLSYHSDRESVTVDEAGKVTIARSFEGTATVTITAEDENYEKAEQAIQITVSRAGKTDLSGYSAELEYKSAVYTGKTLEPSVTVAGQGKTLEKGTDYSVVYKNNINAGEAAVVITGQGSYTGTIERKFTIEKAQNAITVEKVEYEFSASAQEEQAFKLKAAAKGGRLSYHSNSESVTVDQKGEAVIAKNFAGNVIITVSAEDDNYEMAEQSVAVTVHKINNIITAANYTKTAAKKNQKFALRAKCKGSGKLSYRSSMKSVSVNKKGIVTVRKNFVGTAKITIRVNAEGIYNSALKTITVTVNPAATKIVQLKSLSGRKLKVKWKKGASVNGYQIQYGIHKKFQKAKSKKIANKTKTSVVCAKLKAKKKYYVRIRTYKKISGKVYYSAWSKPRMLKTN